MYNLLRTTLFVACRVIVSLTFIASGLVKLVDPRGFAIKLAEYAATLNLSVLLPHPNITLMIAVTVSIVEFLFGLFLLLAINRRLTTWGILGMLFILTPLTLYIALTDAVIDCGCFGEAFHLSNWETFIKNIILLSATLVLKRWWRNMHHTISNHTQWLIRLFALSYSLFVAYISIYHLPLIDFMPYSVGERIGETDETLNFIAIDSQSGEDHTTEILSSDYALILASPSIEHADDSEMGHINILYTYALHHNIPMIMLTATEDAKAIERWCDLTGAEYPILWCDVTDIEMMVRSNPGLLLLKEGLVLGKWASSDIPLADESKTISEQVWVQTPQHGVWYNILKMLLWFVIPLCIVYTIDKLYTFITKRRE